MDQTLEQATVSSQLARYILKERTENADAATLARVKHALAHHLAMAGHGLTASDPDSMRAVGLAREFSEGGGRCTVIGQDFRATPADAAFANCQMMRSFCRDDVILETGVHPGLVVLPVALTIAEREQCSGRELMTAILVGYEMMGKFARWSWSLAVPRRATMPFGAFGGLAAAARLLKLDEDQTTVALAYAANLAMGLAENDLGPISHYYGLVCRNALTAAYLARSGAWGSPTAIEGRFGFIDTFLGCQRIEIDTILASLGPPYAIHQTTEKRYPGTALNQVPIELMRDIILSGRIRASEIERIRIDLPVERRNFDAGHRSPPFADGTTASSIAFQFAMLAFDGDLRSERYAEYESPELCAFAERCEFRFVDGKPIRYARVEVITKGRKTFVREGDFFAFAPYSIDTILRNGMSELLPGHKVDQLINLIDQLECVADVREIMGCLVP
jgi:2-methylcitrate dehydratase PrpD